MNETNCNCKEMTCKNDCTKDHTHKVYSCKECGIPLVATPPNDYSPLPQNDYSPLSTPQSTWEQKLREQFGYMKTKFSVEIDFEHLVSFISEVEQKGEERGFKKAKHGKEMH